MQEVTQSRVCVGWKAHLCEFMCVCVVMQKCLRVIHRLYRITFVLFVIYMSPNVLAVLFCM